MRTRVSNSGGIRARAWQHRERLRAARQVPGPDHPLARATDLVRTLEKQAGIVLVVTAASAAATAAAVPVALTVLSAALVVEFALVMALKFAREVRAERAWDVIIAGGESVDVAEVARERARLSDPRRREQLADTLAQALDSAERWHQILVASRPPEGLRVLRHFAPEVRAIVAQIRDQHADVRGIALLARFLAGGYFSFHYSAATEAVGHELARIAYLLPSPTISRGAPGGRVGRGLVPGTRSAGARHRFCPSAVDRNEQRDDQDRDDVRDLDHRVDRRAGGVLVRVADGVPGDGCGVSIGALAAVRTVLDQLLRVVPGAAARRHRDREEESRHDRPDQQAAE